MERLQNVLVGVDLHQGDLLVSDDFSPTTVAAIDQACELASYNKADLTLCAVLEISEQALHLIEIDHLNVKKTVEDNAAEALQRLVAIVKERGLNARTVIRIGRSWEELTREAIEGAHDCVVVGTRERGKASRMLFGSTAQKLIRFCPCPVWIVKPAEVREIREVLVASDLSEAAQSAVQTAVRVAGALNAKLFLVHSLEFPFETYLRTAGVSEEEVVKYRATLHKEANEKLQAQIAATDARTLTQGVQIHVLEGTPDDAIPDFVDKHEVDVVVIGTQGRSGISGVLLGNTAERLLPHLHASLVAVKPAGYVSPYERKE
ncbi:universal stress protein [Planctellipticum variicoloris]|uniref:universal stress protein n=1 Tax=Planctellipticum variicoloris TaxID=3064265 RepID=UPI002C1DB2BC|nr:universal stress protein [Planctomycetaceae bacterium SH412]HTN03778.1 universal stress protein [Planctomycetaceae bacterium]